MTVQVVVGDATPENGSHKARGTIAVRLASRQQPDKLQVTIEVAAASDVLYCAVQLTISEAEVLYSALDSLIFEAALGSEEKEDS